MSKCVLLFHDINRCDNYKYKKLALQKQNQSFIVFLLTESGRKLR